METRLPAVRKYLGRGMLTLYDKHVVSKCEYCISLHLSGTCTLLLLYSSTFFIVIRQLVDLRPTQK